MTSPVKIALKKTNCWPYWGKESPQFFGDQHRHKCYILTLAINSTVIFLELVTWLPCLGVYVKFQFVNTSTSKIGSQLVQASTSSHVLLGRGIEKAFNGCLGVSGVLVSKVGNI